MRISSNSKLGVALAVLRKIKMSENSVLIQTYSNGREQGFFVTSFLKIKKDMRVVSFAEHRNSDDIVVQFGRQDDFNDYGIFKSDKKYEINRRFFRYNDTDGAAKFITEWLTYKIK